MLRRKSISLKRLITPFLQSMMISPLNQVIIESLRLIGENNVK